MPTIPLDPLSIVIYASAAFFLIILVLILRLEFKFRRLLIGQGAKSLEDSLSAINNDLKDFRQFMKGMEQYLTTVETRLKKSVQAVETVRYNPFKGTGSGGNNSSSSAFLNERGDGIVLTSLYARDRISMFAKPIKNFASEYELSEEEVQAIESCKNKLTNQ